MISDPVVPKDGGALDRLRVLPNAKGAGLQRPCGDAAPKPTVAAPPVDGRANAEVERFVARMTGAAPSGVRVVRDLSGGDKTVFVEGAGAEWVREVFRSRRR